MAGHRLLLLAAVPFFLHLLATAPPSLSAETKKEAGSRNWVPTVVKKLKPAIVLVRATRIKQKQRSIELGLGVLVDPKGIVVTPFRHIEGAAAIEVQLSDGRKFAVKVPPSDAKTEVAVLKLESKKPLPHAAFGDSEKMKAGDQVISLDIVWRSTPLDFWVNRGIFTGSHRASPKAQDLLYMDSGNTSFPSEKDLLFNKEGKVIGIWTKTGAVPSNRVQEIVKQVLKNK